MIECACCEKPIKTNRLLGNQKYCSETCAQMYKYGTVEVSKLITNKPFSDKYSLRNIIRQAEQDGHEYVTVRFNN
jgi:hypothetical protein